MCVCVGDNVTPWTFLVTVRERERERERDRMFEVGERVSASWDFGVRWYPGIVAEVHADETYDILYDDGDVEYNVSNERIKAQESLDKKLNDVRIVERRFCREMIVRRIERHSEIRRRITSLMLHETIMSLHRIDRFLPRGVFEEMWGFVVDKAWKSWRWNKDCVDMTSPHIYPLAWCPSNRCLTCFKRGNAATSIVSNQALKPNRSCVVYFRNRHRQSGITIGIVTKFHEIFRERLKSSRGDEEEEDSTTRGGKNPEHFEILSRTGRGYRDVEICRSHHGWGLYIPQRSNDPEVCGIYRDGRLYRRLDMTFDALRELLNESNSVMSKDERISRGLTSTSPNMVHELQINYADEMIRFVLNDVPLTSLDIRVSELTSQNIFISATLYESGQEIGLLGEPFHNIDSFSSLSSSSSRRSNTNCTQSRVI